MTKEQIKDIADNIDCGFKCFIHMETKDMKFIPDMHKHPDVETDAWADDIESIDKHLAEYIEIEGMESRDSFRVMADFVETVTNEQIKEKLMDALGGPKPFRYFKYRIDNSGEYRDKWFKFKEQKLIDWVESQLRVARL